MVRPARESASQGFPEDVRWETAGSEPLRVLGLPIQQIQGMRNQISHRFKRFDRAAGTARDIQDQSLAANSADAAAERREWSFLRACKPHTFADAADQTLADRLSRLRRDVALGDSGSTSGHNESRFQRKMNERILNLHGIVWDDSRRGHAKAELFQQLADSRPGDIYPFAASARIADRHDGGGQQGCLRSCG